nr:hypothetical protein HK105_007829 [Polyrhizophydium stewartii]
MPVESQMYTSFMWRVPDLATSNVEKLVSPPFGPRDWAWQIILYPDGAGDAKGAHASVFLRPVKSEAEIVAKDAWTRPVTSFTMRIPRGTSADMSAQQEQLYDEEGQPVPSHDPNQLEPQYLISQTSEPSFTCFSATQPGWGFPEFYELPLPADVIDPADGSATILVEVTGPQSIQTSTMVYEFETPSIAAAATGSTLEPFCSQPFGPTGCSWTVQVFCNGSPKALGSHISCFLAPVKSEFEESLGSQWIRTISTLTITLLHPQSRAPLTSKSITGGFVFADAADMQLAGWDQLLGLDELAQAVPGVDSVLVSVAVTWDPVNLARGTTLGKVKTALSSTSATLKKYKAAAQTLRERVVLAATALASKTTELAGAQIRAQAFADRLAILQKRVADAESEIRQTERANAEVAALRERIALLTHELAVARDSQAASERQLVLLTQTRARLASLRSSLEDVNTGSPRSVSNAGSDDISSPVGELDPIVMHMRVVQMQRQVAELEFDLAQTRAALNASVRQQVDQILSEPIEPSDAPKPPPLERLAAAIEAAANETNIGRATLDETNSKILVLGSATPRSERLSIIAELSMVQCGLDVALASLLEIYDEVIQAGQQPPPEFANSFAELQAVCAQLLQSRRNLEDDAFMARLDRGEITAAQLSVHIPPAQVDHDHELADDEHAHQHGVINGLRLHTSPSFPAHAASPDIIAVHTDAPVAVAADGTGTLPPPPIAPPPIAPPPVGSKGVMSRPPASRPPLPGVRSPILASLISNGASVGGVSHAPAVHSPLSPPPGMFSMPSMQSSGIVSDTGSRDFDRISSRMDNIVDMLKTALNNQNTVGPDGVPISIAARASTLPPLMIGPSGAEWDPEIWTPDGRKNAGIDAETLRTLLNEIDRKKRSMSSMWALFITIVLAFFAAYSTIYVVCDPTAAPPSHRSLLQPYQGVCQETILPAWNTMRTTWHDAASDLVVNVVPSTLAGLRATSRHAARAAKHVRGAVVDTMRRAVEQADTPVVPRERRRGPNGELLDDDEDQGTYPRDHNVPKTAVQQQPAAVQGLDSISSPPAKWADAEHAREHAEADADAAAAAAAAQAAALGLEASPSYLVSPTSSVTILPVGDLEANVRDMPGDADDNKEQATATGLPPTGGASSAAAAPSATAAAETEAEAKVTILPVGDLGKNVRDAPKGDSDEEEDGDDDDDDDEDDDDDDDYDDDDDDDEDEDEDDEDDQDRRRASVKKPVPTAKASAVPQSEPAPSETPAPAASSVEAQVTILPVGDLEANVQDLPPSNSQPDAPPHAEPEPAADDAPAPVAASEASDAVSDAVSDAAAVGADVTDGAKSVVEVDVAAATTTTSEAVAATTISEAIAAMTSTEAAASATESAAAASAPPADADAASERSEL